LEHFRSPVKAQAIGIEVCEQDGNVRDSSATRVGVVGEEAAAPDDEFA
jgi:hypothetical protein